MRLNKDPVGRSRRRVQTEKGLLFCKLLIAPQGFVVNRRLQRLLVDRNPRYLWASYSGMCIADLRDASA